MYEKDLALNDLQWSICHKTNQIIPNFSEFEPKLLMSNSQNKILLLTLILSILLLLSPKSITVL